MNVSYDVLVVGDYYIDLVFSGLPRFPEPGREVFARAFAMIPGGAYNAAIAMHRLGLGVGWAADFGTDDFSAFVLERARAEGLDESLFARHSRSLRHITVAANYGAERAFLTYDDPAPPVPAGMKALSSAPARAVYVAGLYYGAFLDAGRLLARARRMKLIMDGNSSDDAATLADPAVRRAIQGVDLFMPNAAEARRMAGCADLPAALAALADLCPLVVVKDGAGGAYACRRGQTFHAPALQVTPVDTTGAGDCFNAGFIKAWLDGLPVEECLRWGNVVGGLSTTALGGTGRRITAEDVRRELAAIQTER